MRNFWDEPKFKRCKQSDVTDEAFKHPLPCPKNEMVFGDSRYLYRIMAKGSKLQYYRSER